MFKKCFWRGVLNCLLSHHIRTFACFILSALSLVTSYYSGLRLHITFSKGSWLLKQTNFYPNLSLSHNLFSFSHSTHCNCWHSLQFSYLIHFVVCFPSWNVNHRRADTLSVLFALASPVLRTLLGKYEYRNETVFVWLLTYPPRRMAAPWRSGSYLG